MLSAYTLMILVVVFSLVFDYINGFHDTANAIATVVSTRVMSPRIAILMAAGLNLLGALVAAEVAKTIAKDILTHPQMATQPMVLAAVVGAIVWNLITWRFGIPSSSSHALIGGLIGAALSHQIPTHGNVNIVHWSGVTNKVLLPLVLSPVAGFFVGYLLMTLIARFCGHMSASRAGRAFRSLQIFSAATMAFSHGLNDAQKSMGIITLALVANGYLVKPEVPAWVKLACAIAMALGTSAGGWRIIKTMGHKIIRLEPVNGFAAETAGATVILVASKFGMPVSTTHVIAGSIFGVGSSKRLSAVRWQVASSMVTAWVVTIPAAALVSAVAYWIITPLSR